MDYKRIYKEFIADRLEHEPPQFVGVNYHARRKVEAEALVQHHHIQPSSLGGSNDATNIVTLSPRDHIHAHLLLAKIHGDKMWAAVKLMFENDIEHSLTRIPSKKQKALYEIAVERHAESMEGENNTFFGLKHTIESLSKMRDQTVYRLCHKDGAQAQGIQAELTALTGLPQRAVNGIVRGEKNSYNGWYDADRFDAFPEQAEQHREAWRARQEKISLYHRDGRVWHGYPLDAPINFSLIKSSGYRHVDGWFADRAVMLSYENMKQEQAQKAADARGDISGANNPRADSRLWRWVNEDTGEEFIGTRFEAYNSGRMTKTGVCSVFQRRQRRTGGWLFIGEVETTAKEG